MRGMMKILEEGVYTISDRIDIAGVGAGYFAFARGWLLEIVDLDGGKYCFLSDGREVRPSGGRFGVYYPGFTLVKPLVENARGSVRGIGAVEQMAELPDKPVMFDTDFEGEFTKLSQAIDVFKTARNSRSIEINTEPSLISIRAKRLIDENYLIYPSIARIAARLKISPEHLSRQFKRDFTLSPSSYLHQLRVADATFRLSVGEPIIDISHEVGYNDLSRFYKQFRKQTRTSPAICRSMLER